MLNTENNKSIEEKLYSVFKDRLEKKKDSTFKSGRHFAIGQKKYST